MRKIAVLKIEYTYVNTPDSEARADRFYKWLINKAIDNLLKKKQAIDNNSTLKYTEDNDKSGRIPYTGRSSYDTKSQENHDLQDVQGGKTTGSKVWQGLENKQQKTDISIGGKI